MKSRRSVNVSSIQDSYTLEELWSGDTVDLAEYRYINYDYQRLREVAYDTYVATESLSSDKPRMYAIDPSTKGLMISPVDGVYTLDLHYIRTLQELSANLDVPILPPRHHQLIIYMAIVKLSTFVGNSTLYDTYSFKSAEGMGQLLREENPYREVRKRPLA